MPSLSLFFLVQGSIVIETPRWALKTYHWLSRLRKIRGRKRTVLLSRFELMRRLIGHECICLSDSVSALLSTGNAQVSGAFRHLGTAGSATPQVFVWGTKIARCVRQAGMVETTRCDYGRAYQSPRLGNYRGAYRRTTGSSCFVQLDSRDYFRWKHDDPFSFEIKHALPLIRLMFLLTLVGSLMFFPMRPASCFLFDWCRTYFFAMHSYRHHVFDPRRCCYTASSQIQGLR